MLEREVAPGIYRIEDSYTNWCLVEDDGRVTIVDAGVPTWWSSLVGAMRELGRSPDEIDAPLTRKPRLYGRERSPLHYVATKPRALPIVMSFLARGAFWPTPVEQVDRFGDDGEPGPQIVSQAATADSQRNLESLDALAETGARTVLTGNGNPWRDGGEAVVERARSRGVT